MLLACEPCLTATLCWLNLRAAGVTVTAGVGVMVPTVTPGHLAFAVQQFVFLFAAVAGLLLQASFVACGVPELFCLIREDDGVNICGRGVRSHKPARPSGTRPSVALIEETVRATDGAFEASTCGCVLFTTCSDTSISFVVASVWILASTAGRV